MREMNGFSFVFVHLHSPFTLSFLSIMAWQDPPSSQLHYIISSSHTRTILKSTHIPLDTFVAPALVNTQLTLLNTNTRKHIRKINHSTRMQWHQWMVKFVSSVFARRIINAPQDVDKGRKRVIGGSHFQYFQIAMDELKRLCLACQINHSFV